MGLALGFQEASPCIWGFRFVDAGLWPQNHLPLSRFRYCHFQLDTGDELDQLGDVRLISEGGLTSGTMGQPVTFLSTNSPKPGVIRFELNRFLTGMGHERYQSGDEILGDRPADILARRIFQAGEVETIHIYGSVVTVTLSSTDVSDLEIVVRELYTYYVPGVAIPTDEELVAMVEG